VKTTVLAVDDEQDILISLKMGLEGMDPEIEVYTASSGTECIEIISDILPDIILMDIMMPDMDGWETVAKLKKDEKYADIPIIFVTGMVDNFSRTIGSITAQDYITKPFSLDTVMRKIRDTVDSEGGNEYAEDYVRSETFKLICQILCVACFLVFFITFLVAYTHPSRSVVVQVNALGEGNVELAIVSLLLLFGLGSIYYAWRDLVRAIYARRTLKLLKKSEKLDEIVEHIFMSLAHIISAVTSPLYATYVLNKMIDDLSVEYPLLKRIHVGLKGEVYDVKVDRAIGSMSTDDVGRALDELIHRIDSIMEGFKLKKELWYYLRPIDKQLKPLHLHLK